MTGLAGHLPRDAALPAMPELLDPAAMTPVLHRSLETSSAPEVRIHYLRYKPATNLVVHYDVGVPSRWHHASAMIASRDFLGRRAAKPEHVALAREVNGRSPAAAPLAYDLDLRAMIQWLPLDISLPALATPASELRLRLRSAGVPSAGPGGEPTLLAYKPRRRAVLRLDDCVLKLYSKQAHFERATAGLRATSALGLAPMARFLATLPELRLTAQTALHGRELDSSIEGARLAGTAIARLHRSALRGLDPMLPVHQLDAALASARLARTVAPGLAPPIGRLEARLAAALPDADRLVPSHGDFSPHQLLVAGGEPALIDFDELCAAPPALDLATYVAYLVRDAPGREAAGATMQALLEGYGRRPPALDWYLASALLRRAPAPFRRQEQNWPARVEAMIAAAQAALAD